MFKFYLNNILPKYHRSPGTGPMERRIRTREGARSPSFVKAAGVRPYARVSYNLVAAAGVHQSTELLPVEWDTRQGFTSHAGHEWKPIAARHSGVGSLLVIPKVIGISRSPDRSLPVMRDMSGRPSLPCSGLEVVVPAPRFETGGGV